jgi:hypothetical protein
MNTEQALDHTDKSGASLANVNPHWWIQRSGDKYRVDYCYCDNPDCDCHQYDFCTRDEILSQFPDDDWQEILTK